MKTMVKVGALCAALGLLGCGGGRTAEPGSGAAPSVRTPGLAEAHYANVTEMLRGKVPGLEVIEVESGRIEVRIRGMTQSLQESSQEPLIVVDGVASSRPAGEVLMGLNPNEVASINVLRDVSSTAVYGTRAANGVILVEMKKRD